MGSSWIDTLNARRDAAAQPQDVARPLPGTIAAARAATAPPVDTASLRQELSQMVRDEVANATIAAARAATAPPVDTASLRQELSQMVRDEVANAMTDVSDMLRNVVGAALGTAAASDTAHAQAASPAAEATSAPDTAPTPAGPAPAAPAAETPPAAPWPAPGAPSQAS